MQQHLHIWNFNAYRGLVSVFFIIFFLPVVGFSQNSQLDYGQNLRSYTLSSPEVSSFEKYNLTGTQNYTGKVNISIPIYTAKSGNLEYPINLVYNSGGIKVDQLSSDVGLGWNLTNAVITRTINAGNDFDNTGLLSYQPDYNSYSATDKSKDMLVLKKSLGFFLSKEMSPENVVVRAFFDIDMIPDTYHFFGNGPKTDFFFSSISTPVEISPQGTKIETVIGNERLDTKRGNYWPGWTPSHDFITRDFFSIVITTNEGIRYTFSDCDFSLTQDLGGAELISPAQISAWHITKIEDLKTGRKIDFEYDTTSSNPNHPAGTAEAFDKKNAQRSFGYSTNVTPSSEQNFYNSEYQNPVARIDIRKKRLRKIISESTEIIFNYNNSGVSGEAPFVRNDIYMSDCVTQIYVRDKHLNPIKSFNFRYSYFVSDFNNGEFNPDGSLFNTTRYHRLKLLSFEENGKPKHKFSYEEGIKLPPVNSFSVDFLGYYNNSIDTECCLFYPSRTPQLYYYPNQFEKSLLPFPVSGATHTVIPGFFDRQANEYAKAWSLIKIEYPTGGAAQFSYEPNEFEIFGQSIKGGGIRIAEQKLDDGNGNERKINYLYQKPTGVSSGRLFSMPFFGFPTKGDFGLELSFAPDELSPPVLTYLAPNSNIEWQLYDKSNLNAEITSGSYVGYSRVVELETGNGRKEYKYTSSDLPSYENNIYRMNPKYLSAEFNQVFFGDLLHEYDQYGNPRLDEYGNPEYRFDSSSDWAISNSAIFSNLFTDNAYKRGKLLELNIYNEAGLPVKKTNVSYGENLSNTHVFHQGFVHLKTFPEYVNPYVQDYYREYSTRNMEAFMIIRKEIKISNFLPSSTTVTNFLNGISSTSTTSFSYNDFGLISETSASTSTGDYNVNKYYYVTDTGMAVEPFSSNILSNNMTGVVLKKERYRNSTKLSEDKTEYSVDASTNNLTLPKSLHKRKGEDTNGPLEKIVNYDRYDSSGNLLQYRMENGMTHCTIWGYFKTVPLAEVSNITYDQISANLISDAQLASNTSNNEFGLLAALAALRSQVVSSGGMISTYTYYPMVGVRTKTDVKGNKTTYSYDPFGRLLKVLDNDGNIISEYEYNYKPQN